MKNSLLFIVLISIALFSCKPNKYATSGGKYESDDAYYQPNDKYISDFALVDDEARMDNSTSSQQPEVDSNTNTNQDDYYSGNSDTSSDITTGNTYNYYGNVNQSPWNYGGYGCNNGFGNYGYGSFSNWPQSSVCLGWSPWSGWNTSFNFGYNWGYSPYYGGWNNGWYSPYYGMGCFNQWGYNTWYSPYNFNNPYFGFNNPYYGGYYNGSFWGDGDAYANTIHGHHNPLATTTAVNSTYGNDVFYSGRNDKPMFANDPSVSSISSRPSKQEPTIIESTNISPTATSEKLPPAVQPTAGATKPSYASAPSNNIVSLNPGPVGNTSVFTTQMQSAEKPRPTYTQENTRPVIKDTPSSRPSRDIPQSTNYQKPAYSSPSTRPDRSNPTPQYSNPERDIQPARAEPHPQRQERPQVRPQQKEPRAPQPTVKPDKDSPAKVPQGNSKGGGFSPSPSSREGSPAGGGGGKTGGGGTITGPRKK